jgi:hypothetical protein
MLPKLSKAALLGILWVTRLFIKSNLCDMLVVYPKNRTMFDNPLVGFQWTQSLSEI